ncbi:MAG: hypothetical protein ACI92Z_000107 [Paracoccaceae bacterium]|jgi:hypothetical protein
MLSDRFVINDAQWILMEWHYFGKKRDLPHEFGNRL